MKPGKGAAFVRTKLRNYITGNTVERTFRAGEQVCIYVKKVHIHLLRLRSLCFPHIGWALVCLVVSWYMSLDQIRLNNTDVTHISHFMFCGGFQCMSNTCSPQNNWFVSTRIKSGSVTWLLLWWSSLLRWCFVLF